MVKDVLLPLRSRFDSQLVFLSVKSFFLHIFLLTGFLKRCGCIFVKLWEQFSLLQGKITCMLEGPPKWRLYAPFDFCSHKQSWEL